ncbi:hypothetical protein FPV67DRAFT_1486194 [Lyophyllum atratum]|nr:hypothetical protein FPV67DRAFT_1486194 [Lyophyllum atratum]
MHQLSRILLSVPRPPYLQHGTPAVIFGKLAAVLAQWTALWMRPTSPTFSVHPSLPPGTPTSPLKPTPTASSQDDTQVHVTLTLAAIFACAILILGTFCAMPRLSGRAIENSPPLLKTPVKAPNSPPPPPFSLLSFLQGRASSFKFLLLVLKSTLGRFQLSFFTPTSSLLLWSWRWQQLCANLSHTLLNVTHSTLGWVLLFSKSLPTSPRLLFHVTKLALCSFHMPRAPALLAFYFNRTKSMVELCINFLVTVFDIAGSTTGRFWTLVIMPAAQPFGVSIYSSTMHISKLYYENLRLLGYAFIVDIILCYFILGELPSLFAQAAIQSITPIVGLHILRVVLVLVFVVFECELINRLIILPNQYMATHNRLRILANGQTRREICHRLVGVTDIRSVTLLGLVFCAVVAILREAVDQVFPSFGWGVVVHAIVMIVFIRGIYFRCKWTTKDAIVPIDLPLEIIFDPHLPLEFVIDDGDDLPDEANNNEGDGGTLAFNVCCCEYRVTREGGGSHDGPKGIG